MPSLLVATSTALLRYDLEADTCELVERDRPTYYGISWFPGDDRLFTSHSCLPLGGLASAEGYMHSEVGFLADGKGQSRPILSNPHQIRCLEAPYCAVTNTGRNSLLIFNTDDWSHRQIRFDEVLWDRFDASGQGAHFNSIDFDGATIRILAHNFDLGSYEIALDWPNLDNPRRRALPGKQMHNLWYRANGEAVSCHSPEGSLVEIATGRTLWRCPGLLYYTRGLASDAEHVFVGATEIAARGERHARDSRIFVLEAATYETVREINLGAFGDVTEIRVLDALDLCHPVGAFVAAETLRGQTAVAGAAEDDSSPGATMPVKRDAPTMARMIMERDESRDIAHEAMQQRDRFERELAQMLIERNEAWGQRDEARAHQDRLQQELEAMAEQRNAALGERDEARAQQDRFQYELDVMAGERDTFLGERDEACAQQDRLQHELDAMLRERDAAWGERDEALAQQDRLQRELDAMVAERDKAWGERDEARSARRFFR